jgi:hypothetical protein
VYGGGGAESRQRREGRWRRRRILRIKMKLIISGFGRSTGNAMNGDDDDDDESEERKGQSSLRREIESGRQREKTERRRN